MHWLAVAVALLAACHGGKPARKDAGPSGPALSVSVPKLPPSDDGVAALAILDKSIELAGSEARKLVPLLLERAAIRSRLEDYEGAMKASAELVAAAPADPAAWQLRVRSLLRVHDFARARAALAKLAPLVHPSELVEHEIVLAEASGDSERALAMREALASKFPSPANLTAWAATLAQEGRTDEAIAIIPRAAAAVRDNPPQLLAWLLFQWGRCYELAGQHAVARKFFEAAHARMPGYAEATVHLVETLLASRDTTGARKVVDEDRQVPGVTPHPELMALAVRLGHTEISEGARAEWERYVKALPLAFSDHAARFYLVVYRYPARALQLARVNFGNRPTRDARALLVEAALEAGDVSAACAAVDQLVSGGTRAQRFMAWKALSQCGRNSDATRLARELGIER